MKVLHGMETFCPDIIRNITAYLYPTDALELFYTCKALEPNVAKVCKAWQRYEPYKCWVERLRACVAYINSVGGDIANIDDGGSPISMISWVLMLTQITRNVCMYSRRDEHMTGCKCINADLYNWYRIEPDDSYTGEAVTSVAELGNLSLFKYLFSFEIDPFYREKLLRRAFSGAFRAGHIAFAEELLYELQDEQAYYAAVRGAIKHGYDEYCIKNFGDRMFDKCFVESGILKLVAKRGSVAMMESYYDAAVAQNIHEHNIESAFCAAIENNRLDIVKVFLSKNFVYHEALTVAIKNDKIALLRLIAQSYNMQPQKIIDIISKRLFNYRFAGANIFALCAGPSHHPAVVSLDTLRAVVEVSSNNQQVYDTVLMHLIHSKHIKEYERKRRSELFDRPIPIRGDMCSEIITAQSIEEAHALLNIAKIKPSKHDELLKIHGRMYKDRCEG